MMRKQLEIEPEKNFGPSINSINLLGSRDGLKLGRPRVSGNNKIFRPYGYLLQRPTGMKITLKTNRRR